MKRGRNTRVRKCQLSNLFWRVSLPDPPPPIARLKQTPFKFLLNVSIYLPLLRRHRACRPSSHATKGCAQTKWLTNWKLNKLKQKKSFMNLQSTQDKIPPMKNRSREKTCFKNQSNERVRFKKRSTAMYKNSRWASFQMNAFTWSIFEICICTWSIFHWRDRVLVSRLI